MTIIGSKRTAKSFATSNLTAGDIACDGGDSPTGVPRTGMRLWLSADVGVTLDGSGNVFRWDDRSPGGRDCLQETAAQRPPLVTGAIAGLPTVEFGAANANLRYDGGYIIDPPDSGRHLFVVCRPGVAAGGAVFSFDDGAGKSAMLGLNFGGPLAFAGSVTVSHWDSFVDLSGEVVLLEYLATDLTDLVFRVNAIDQAIDSSTMEAALSSGYTVGNRLPVFSQVFGGEIGEVLLYDQPQTGAALAAIRSYLNRWGWAS